MLAYRLVARPTDGESCAGRSAEVEVFILAFLRRLTDDWNVTRTAFGFPVMRNARLRSPRASRRAPMQKRHFEQANRFELRLEEHASACVRKQGATPAVERRKADPQGPASWGWLRTSIGEVGFKGLLPP